MDNVAFLSDPETGGPSGVELRNDPRFHAIERILEPASRSARQDNLAKGGTGTIPVDWADALQSAAQLCTRGRDLRLLVIVARAMANERGFQGLADGLGLLSTTVRAHWDNLHPALREAATPREAAIRRVNALYQIENADNGLLCDLEFNRVFAIPLLGAVTGGDLAAAALSPGARMSEAAKGLGEAERAAIASQHDKLVKRVTAACLALATDHAGELADLRSGLSGARAALQSLEAGLSERLGGNGSSVTFSALGQFLARMAQTLAVPAEAPAQEAPGGDAATPASTIGQSAGPARLPDRLTSRGEVERCLDLVIAYYEANEPASPLPHLARRMRRMVAMNFLQLMEEVAPGGVKEFRALAGVEAGASDQKPK